MRVVYVAFGGEEAVPIRVLMAIAPTMYGQALAYALQMNRPQVEVVRVEPDELDGRPAGDQSHPVACNGSDDEAKALAPSWAALSYPRTVEADVYLGGRRSTIEDVRVEDVLVVMDEAEQLSAEAT
jgi:hypothetical protein